MITHGGVGSRLYQLWDGMIARCYRVRSGSYHKYGKQGIRVCRAWRKFAAFQVWAKQNGYKEHLTLDRRDSTKGYNPDNCRWATYRQQTASQRKRKGCSSRFIGVGWYARKRKWVVQINSTHHGYFDDEISAAWVSDHFARLAYGEFANLNNPRNRRKRRLRVAVERRGRNGIEH